MIHPLHRLFFLSFRRAVALLTAVVILAGALGIPLPRLVHKDTSQPFPCMHHACGCMSAEACWQGCCCLTHEQKLAWARRHQVEPPAGILPVARHTAVPAGSCCRAEKCAEDAGSKMALGIVRIDDFRQCQGETPLWLVLSQALLPRSEGASVDPLAATGWLAPSLTVQRASPAFDPATPPPRAAL